MRGPIRDTGDVCGGSGGLGECGDSDIRAADTSCAFEVVEDVTEAVVVDAEGVAQLDAGHGVTGVLDGLKDAVVERACRGGGG